MVDVSLERWSKYTSAKRQRFSEFITNDPNICFLQKVTFNIKIDRLKEKIHRKIRHANINQKKVE